MPDTILTISHCFTDVAPDDWAVRGYKYEDEERAEQALKFGIPGNAVPALVDLFSRESLYHNAFPTLPVAQEFYRHCADKRAVVLVGIGLEPSLLDSVYPQLKDEANHGYALIERLEARQALASGGKALGYEPLGYEATKFHSCLCHNAPVEANQQFGIRPNRDGFIDSFADATRVTRHLKATGAVTAIWEPWLVVRYGE